MLCTRVGIDGLPRTTFQCGICGRPVTDLPAAAAIYPDDDVEGRVLIAHKGYDCFERKFGGVGVYWEELTDFAHRLAAGAGLDVRGLIDREVNSSATLTASESCELEGKVDELVSWFTEKGVHAAVLGNATAAEA